MANGALASPGIVRGAPWGSVAAGLLLFTAVVGGAQGLVALNAATGPALPWFPLPVLGALAAAVVFARRRYPLRLTHRPAVPWARAYAFALLATAAGVCAGLVEGHVHGLIRSPPAWPGVESAAFDAAFLLTLPFVASVMAEVCFRGIIQGRLEPHVSLVPLLLGIAVLNGLMHFYDPDQLRQGVRFLSLNLAWGYVTWRTRSLLPALTAHVLMNVVEPGAEWLAGPVELGALAPATVGLIVIAGVAALGGALAALGGWSRPGAA